ncbi:MAG: cation:proton antiporter [Promethearchaeota archaeon]
MSELAAIYTLIVVIFAGVLVGRAAEIYKFPKTIPLILTGLVLTFLVAYTDFTLELDVIRDTTLLVAELALIVVLFKEGMHTNITALRRWFLPILLLAFFGTFLTAFLVGISIELFHFTSITFLAALLVGATISPTDPAATFSILRGGGTRVKEQIETILGGESAFNDVIAILLVVIIFVPQLIEGKGQVQFSFNLIILGIWAISGGILIGILIGWGAVRFISIVEKKSEISFITLSAVFLIFVISEPLQISSAIAAIVSGVIIRNPSFIGIETFFSRAHLYDFWDDVTFLFEIVAFIFIGVLLSIDILPSYFFIAILISLIVIISRIIAVFVVTLPLEFQKKTAEFFSNKERLFVGIAGFKGLTTAILALFAYVNLEPLNHPLAELLLYSSLIVILLTGTLQGLIIRPLSNKTEVVEELSELEEIKAQKIAIEAELEKLVKDRTEKIIRSSDFRRLSYPLKEELYLLEERYQTLLAQEESRGEYLEYQIILIQETLNVLLNAYEKGEISEVAYKRTQNRYLEELNDLNLKKRQLAPLAEGPETKKVTEEVKDVELLLVTDTVEALSKDPQIMSNMPELHQIQKLWKQAYGRINKMRISPRLKGRKSKSQPKDDLTN